MDSIQLDNKILGYLKRGSIILFVAFGLIVIALILAYLNLKQDVAFFLNYLQSANAQTSWGSIASLLGFAGGYLYLLFYMEQHQAFILKESTKEAKLTVEVFMLFRVLAQYCVAI